jgi:hypothetical protein
VPFEAELEGVRLGIYAVGGLFFPVALWNPLLVLPPFVGTECLQHQIPNVDQALGRADKLPIDQSEGWLADVCPTKNVQLMP